MTTHNNSPADNAVLVLADGRHFRGRAFGAGTESFGEINFTTAMSGYQEALTDPASANTLVTVTFPHIGNTGMNSEDDQSGNIWAAGLIVRELSRFPSNWRSETTLEDQLTSHGVSGIEGVDTRALTRHIRDHGVQYAGIFCGANAEKPVAELVAQVQQAQQRRSYQHSSDFHLAELVQASQSDNGSGPEVAVIDFGVKKQDLVSLTQRGAKISVCDPNQCSPAESNADAFLLSDGPLDEAAAAAYAPLAAELIATGKPIFGIGAGMLVLAAHYGAKITRLHVGHHGANHPVRSAANGRIYISAQAQQYAVSAPLPEGLKTSYTHVHDEVVEGFEDTTAPVLAVGFHPEGAGPLDTATIFDQFLKLIPAHS